MLITFTPEKIGKLRAAHDKATANDKKTFWLDCDEYVTAYAGHLLTYLDIKAKEGK